MTDPRNVRRWLATLANAYPSLLVSGVARNALAEIERLDADVADMHDGLTTAYLAGAFDAKAKLAIEKNLNDARQLLTAKLEARLAIAVEALETHQKAMAYHGGDIDFALWEALAKIKETK